MRVIAGKFRGRRLSGISEGIRPTTDRLRESLFASLEGSLEGSTWLDLFAGSGAVGIEALSRGARKAVFVDRDRLSSRLIRRNLESLEIDQGWEVREVDVFAFLRKYPIEDPFDFVFLDPPYAFPNYAKLLGRLAEWPGIGAESRLILEVFKKRAIDFIPDRLVLSRKIAAGDSVHLILRRRPGAGAGGS